MSKELHIHIRDWYKEYHSLFVKMARSFCHTSEEADDMVSQFYLDLLEKDLDPNSIVDCQAYLSTVFRRKLIDAYRSRKTVLSLNGFFGQEQNAEPSVQEKLEHKQANAELMSKLKKAYASLPPRCRRVIYLKFYKGLSTDEIALETGLSARSVYNNMFEGIKLLRHNMRKSSPDFKAETLLLLLPCAVEALF